MTKLLFQGNATPRSILTAPCFVLLCLTYFLQIDRKISLYTLFCVTGYSIQVTIAVNSYGHLDFRLAFLTRYNIFNEEASYIICPF